MACTRLNLFAKVVNVLNLIGCLAVNLWITSAGNVKIAL